MPAFSFYMRPEDALYYERFKQITKREGSNASTHLREYIINYVEVHDPGNPQTRVTSYLDMEFSNASDLSRLEGKIREIFYSRASKGDLLFRDILTHCKQHFNEPRRAAEMASRVESWLKEKGVKIWR